MKKLKPILDFKKTSSNTYEFEVKWETPEGMILEEDPMGNLQLVGAAFEAPDSDTGGGIQFIAETGTDTGDLEASARSIPAGGATSKINTYIEQIKKLRYFWDFGDGNFSTESRPKHVFSDTGEFGVRFLSSNGVHSPDDPPPPPPNDGFGLRVVAMRSNTRDIPPRTNFPISSKAYVTLSSEATLSGASIPKGGRFVLLIKYKNPGPDPISGKIVLSFNGEQDRLNTFLISGSPEVMHEEWVQPSQPAAGFRDALEYHFDDLANETRVIKQFFWVNPNLDLTNGDLSQGFHANVVLDEQFQLIEEGVTLSEITVNVS